MSKTCSVENCNRRYRSSGYCTRHYMQIRFTGKIRKDVDEPKDNCITINGYENYIITTSGDVYSKVTKRYLKPAKSRGYLRVNLNGKNLTVHRMVASTFIPNPENKPHVNHKDGNKLNNNVNNLEWCTPKENARHAFANGLVPTVSCEKHYRAKLKNIDIGKIKTFYSNGIYNQPELSRIFNIDQGQISRILNNKVWKKI